MALFAKAPVPGKVKTRLVPDVTPEAAAELQAALVQDTAAVAAEAARGAARPPCLYCAAAETVDEPFLQALLPDGFRLVRQGPGDLGHRLARVFGELLAVHRSVLAIGSDCPDLTPEILRVALCVLDGADAVIGPAKDGGYWALGLGRRASAGDLAALFRGIPWSTDRAAESTRGRLSASGLAPEELPRLRDLDVYADLLGWARDPNPAFPRTLAWCRSRLGDAPEQAGLGERRRG